MLHLVTFVSEHQKVMKGESGGAMYILSLQLYMKGTWLSIAAMSNNNI